MKISGVSETPQNPTHPSKISLVFSMNIRFITGLELRGGSRVGPPIDLAKISKFGPLIAKIGPKSAKKGYFSKFSQPSAAKRGPFIDFGHPP